jgi:hypothetical protein
MGRTIGGPEVAAGLINGAVFLSHAGLTGGGIREIPGSLREPALIIEVFFDTYQQS